MELLAAFSIVLACSLHTLLPRIIKRLRLAKPNFLGQEVFASYGMVLFADTSALVSIGVLVGLIRAEVARLYISVMGAMCFLGLIDDLYGTREVGGFKGHFRKLVFERKLTTGVVKALGGTIVGAVAGRTVYHDNPARWITFTLLVALWANFLNIFDLRPGRAVGVFLLAIGVTCCVAFDKLPDRWLVAALGLTTLLWGLADSRGKAMMGDSGSNSLGAAVGLTAALSFALPTQVAVIVLLVVIHWYSERHSITKLIENNRILNAIDARLGVR